MSTSSRSVRHDLASPGIVGMLAAALRVAPAVGEDRPSELGLVEPAETDVRVLMYHSFGWFGEQRPAVSPYQLRVQLGWLSEQGIHAVPVSALVEFLEGRRRLPARAVVITIDDGERNAYDVAYPIFREYGVPFAVAVPTEAPERTRSRGTMTWADLREMVGSGLCEVLAHGHTHANLTVLSEARRDAELQYPRRRFAEMLGILPTGLAYPLGAHSVRVREHAAESGYQVGFIAQGGPVGIDTPGFAIPRYAVEQDTSLFAFAYFFRHRG